MMVLNGKAIKREHIMKQKGESKMKILYFAELKELLNRSTETIHLDTTITVQEFESYLLKRHRELKSKNFKLLLMKNSSDKMIWSNQEIQLRSFHRSVGVDQDESNYFSRWRI